MNRSSPSCVALAILDIVRGSSRLFVFVLEVDFSVFVGTCIAVNVGVVVSRPQPTGSCPSSSRAGSPRPCRPSPRAARAAAQVDCRRRERSTGSPEGAVFSSKSRRPSYRMPMYSLERSGEVHRHRRPRAGAALTDTHLRARQQLEHAMYVAVGKQQVVLEAGGLKCRERPDETILRIRVTWLEQFAAVLGHGKIGWCEPSKTSLNSARTRGHALERSLQPRAGARRPLCPAPRVVL